MGAKQGTWLCTRSTLAGSIANFGVQYNFTNISVALLFLGSADKWYSDDSWGGQASSVLKSLVYLGAIFGMLTMGYAGDVLGRNRAFALTSTIMIVSALPSAFLPNGKSNAAMGLLAGTRFLLGWGIGGCYPLSAAKSAEESDSTRVWDRNLAVGVVFFWQTIGDIMPYVVGMVLTDASVLLQFRLTLALGVIPPLFVLALTYNAEESREYSTAAKGVDGQSVPKSWSEQLQIGMDDPEWLKHLAATALCWGIYDVAYYTKHLIACMLHFTTSGTKLLCVGPLPS